VIHPRRLLERHTHTKHPRIAIAPTPTVALSVPWTKRANWHDSSNESRCLPGNELLLPSPPLITYVAGMEGKSQGDPMKKLVKTIRGASMVEYALLLVAVVLLAAGAFKLLGPKVGNAATNAGKQL
jgi:Flp pilus assembly pilin Flp